MLVAVAKSRPVCRAECEGWRQSMGRWSQWVGTEASMKIIPAMSSERSPLEEGEVEVEERWRRLSINSILRTPPHEWPTVMYGGVMFVAASSALSSVAMLTAVGGLGEGSLRPKPARS